MAEDAVDEEAGVAAAAPDADVGSPCLAQLLAKVQATKKAISLIVCIANSSRRPSNDGSSLGRNFDSVAMRKRDRVLHRLAQILQVFREAFDDIPAGLKLRNLQHGRPRQTPSECIDIF